MMCPASVKDIDPDVEVLQQPHVDRDHEVRLDLEDKVERDPRRRQALKAQVRITAKDVRTYGCSPDCPRCTELRARRNQTNKEHPAECRLRMYLAWQSNDDPKYLTVKHLIETDAVDAEPGDVDLDDGSRRRGRSRAREPKELPQPELDATPHTHRESDNGTLKLPLVHLEAPTFMRVMMIMMETGTLRLTGTNLTVQRCMTSTHPHRPHPPLSKWLMLRMSQCSTP